MLHQPLLYLSLFFNQRRNEYYDLLNHVRHTGDWEEWLAFFLEGVRVTAESGTTMSGRLVEAFASDRAAMEQGAGPRAGSALRVLEALKARPVLSLSRVCELTGLSFPTAASAMHTLVERGIARELTGRPRNRLFAYDHSLSSCPRVPKGCNASTYGRDAQMVREKARKLTSAAPILHKQPSGMAVAQGSGVKPLP